MRIDHIAIWAKDIEKLRAFYIKYFEAVPGDLYVNARKNFRSYFLSFEDGCRLEIMQMPDIPDSKNNVHQQFGLDSLRHRRGQ